MSALAALPDWVMLERFVFRRDDEESFPDDTKATIRASGTTSWGASFLVAFRLAEPPGISRLYAQFSSGFPDCRQKPIAILTAHRNLLLIRVGMHTPAQGLVQDFFIFNASAAGNASSLTALPPCILPEMDYSCSDGRVPRHPSAMKRLLHIRSLGLLRARDQVAVAELNLVSTICSEFYAAICLLSSNIVLDQKGVDWGKWKSIRVPIIYSDNPGDTTIQLRCWETDTVIPIGRWLCWIDYCRGILFCDVLQEQIHAVYFLRFPLDKFPTGIDSDLSWLHRGVSAIDDSCVLKFVNVSRGDGISYRSFKPGDGFTITCYTFNIGSMVWNKNKLAGELWEKDFTVTSDDLWSINPPDCLPRGVPMFPQVNINMPGMVYFLINEIKCVMKKMSVVSIDMNTGKVLSSYRYINGTDDVGTEDADLTAEKSRFPVPFLSFEFSELLPRKRKHME